MYREKLTIFIISKIVIEKNEYHYRNIFIYIHETSNLFGKFSDFELNDLRIELYFQPFLVSRTSGATDDASAYGSKRLQFRILSNSLHL